MEGTKIGDIPQGKYMEAITRQWQLMEAYIYTGSYSIAPIYA